MSTRTADGKRILNVASIFFLKFSRVLYNMHGFACNLRIPQAILYPAQGSNSNKYPFFLYLQTFSSVKDCLM
jgi:hypothetical protein